MRIVDSQVHCWMPPSPEFPWDERYAASGPVAAENLRLNAHRPVTPEALIASLDAVGVAQGIIVTPSVYGYDSSFPLSVVARYPERLLGVVGRIDPRDPDLAGKVRGWRGIPGMLALRSVVTSEEHAAELREGVLEPLFTAAEESGIPLCVFWPRRLRELLAVARAHTGLRLVIDHVGMAQPPLMAVDPDRLAALPDLLALAALPRVSVKLSGAATLSVEPYPYRDLWPAVHRILESFGRERVMWGSDFTRVRPVLTYAEGLHWLLDSDELSPGDKEWLFARAAEAVFL